MGDDALFSTSDEAGTPEIEERCQEIINPLPPAKDKQNNFEEDPGEPEGSKKRKRTTTKQYEKTLNLADDLKSVTEKQQETMEGIHKTLEGIFEIQKKSLEIETKKARSLEILATIAAQFLDSSRSTTPENGELY